MIKQLGFDGVELDSPTDLDPSEVKAAMKATGIVVPGLVNSVHWKKPLSDPDPAIRSECTSSMIQSLKDCPSYGGSTVLLVPAVVNEKVSYSDAWDRATKEIDKMLGTAQEYDVQIATQKYVQNFNWSNYLET